MAPNSGYDTYNDPAGIWDEEQPQQPLKPFSPFGIAGGTPPFLPVGNPSPFGMQPRLAAAPGAPGSDPGAANGAFPPSNVAPEHAATPGDSTAKARFLDLLNKYPNQARPLKMWEKILAPLAGGAIAYGEGMRLYGRGDPTLGFRTSMSILGRPQQELEQQRADWGKEMTTAERGYNIETEEADRAAQEKERLANAEFRNRQQSHLEWEEKGGPEELKSQQEQKDFEIKKQNYIAAGYSPAEATAAAYGKERITDPVLELVYENTKNPDGSRNPKAAWTAYSDFIIKEHQAGRIEESQRELALLEKEEKDNLDGLTRDATGLDVQIKALQGSATGMIEPGKTQLAGLVAQRQELQNRITDAEATHKDLESRMLQGLGIRGKNSIYGNPGAGAAPAPAGPARPKGVPANYIYTKNGPGGRAGWINPAKVKQQPAQTQ